MLHTSAAVCCSLIFNFNDNTGIYCPSMSSYCLVGVLFCKNISSIHTIKIFVGYKLISLWTKTLLNADV